MPTTLVITFLELSRFGLLTLAGVLNASYFVQFLTIRNQSWINQFQDKTVISASVIFALLHYLLFFPELITVSILNFSKTTLRIDLLNELP